MADPRLVVDSKDDAFKNPIGFIPNPQEPSQAVIDQFNKEFSLVKGVSALPARESVANKLSQSIALGTTATLPVGNAPKFRPVGGSATKLLGKAGRLNPYVLGATLLVHSEPLGGDSHENITNNLRLRVLDDNPKAFFEKQVGGQWQATGVSAFPIYKNNEIVAFEGLSEKDAKLIGLPTTFPITPPETKPVGGFEAYQGERNSKLEYPANRPDSITHTGHSSTDIPDTSTMVSPLTPEQIIILESRRHESGIVTGKGQPVGSDWMREGIRNGGAPIPEQIADKLRGQEFANFDEFREAFWQEVANDPELAKQFNQNNRNKIGKGYAPFTPPSEQVGGRERFELHHIEYIGEGGDVYNIDNLRIMTPKAQ